MPPADAHAAREFAAPGGAVGEPLLFLRKVTKEAFGIAFLFRKGMERALFVLRKAEKGRF